MVDALSRAASATEMAMAMTSLSTPCICYNSSTRGTASFTGFCSVSPFTGVTRNSILSSFQTISAGGYVRRVCCHAASSSPSIVGSVKDEAVPEPVVQIDQHSEPNATVVELEFGDRLGALLDTAQSLRDLSLNVVRAKVSTEESKGKNRFVLTRTSDGGKIEDPETLEAIRLTIINNLIYYHPEARDRVQGSSVPGKKVAEIPTLMKIESIEEGKRSVLHIETADRPGLIVEIVKVLGDLSINVESAEIDTQGFTAKDEFYVTYRNEALNSSMEEVVVNTLRYFLDRPDIEAEDSY